MAAILIAAGCGEEDVYTLSQVDEMLRFASQSADGKELFSSAAIHFPGQFSMPLDGRAYHQTLDSSKSRLSAVISVTTIPQGSGFDTIPDLLKLSYGEFPYGFVTKTEDLFVTLARDDGSYDTSYAIRFTRVVMMAKIGSNDQPYSGWRAYAVGSNEEGEFGTEWSSTLGDVSVHIPTGFREIVVTGTGNEVGRNFPYYRLEELPAVESDGMVELRTERVSTNYWEFLVTYQSLSGLTIDPLTITNDPLWYHIDTIGQFMPGDDLYRWMSIQTFVRVSGHPVPGAAWMIPFKPE
jgi:hypothetical protein